MYIVKVCIIGVTYIHILGVVVVALCLFQSHFFFLVRVFWCSLSREETNTNKIPMQANNERGREREPKKEKEKRKKDFLSRLGSFEQN